MSTTDSDYQALCELSPVIREFSETLVNNLIGTLKRFAPTAAQDIFFMSSWVQIHAKRELIDSAVLRGILEVEKLAMEIEGIRRAVHTMDSMALGR